MHSSRSAATRLCLLGLLLASGAPAAAEVAAAPLEPPWLAVSVNGQPSDEPLLLQRDSAGGLYASEAQLRAWRIRLPSAGPVTVDGEPWSRIADDPALRAVFSAAEQSLAIEARPELFERQSANLGALDAFEMAPSGTGGFLNYDLFAQYHRGGIGVSGAIEVGAFTRYGVGTGTSTVHAGEGRDRLVRLETGRTIDRPGSLSSIRIGDAIAPGGLGAPPLRFGGLQYARNFATRPGYLTMPLPVLEGSAAVPSVVDIYVNNALHGSQNVQPGPFELTNVPVQSGGGTVQILVRDLLGRQIVSEQAYDASSTLLRRGLHDFSYEIGFVRDGFGRRSMDYGALIASTSHRYGLSDAVTLEGHAQLSRDVQSAGAGVNLALFGLGTLARSASFSRPGRGGGALVAGGFEGRGAGLSFGLRAEYATAGFPFPGMTDDHRPPRLSAQAFADLPVLGGSIGINLTHRDRRGDAEDESLAGLFANVPLIDSATVQFFARRAMAGESRTVFGAHVSLSLGGRRSASGYAEYRGGGDFAHNLSFQEDAPAGIGSGYRAATSMSGARRTTESVYTWNMAPASLGAHVSRAGGSTGIRLSARGSIGLIGDRAFASRLLGSSFAQVQVGGHAGVRVYADNQLVGTTGEDGSIVVPSLRAFDRNMIRIEEGDLPLDVRISETERAVRPFARSGAIVRFDAPRERGVLMQVSLEDGSPLPAGTLVRVVGAPELHVVASGGALYIPSLAGRATLEADWAGGRCSFDAAVPEGDDPQPRIAGLVCRTAATYAAR